MFSQYISPNLFASSDSLFLRRWLRVLLFHMLAHYSSNLSPYGLFLILMKSADYIWCGDF